MKDARDRGIDIYSIGLDPSVRVPQLASVVNDPIRDTYVLKSYDDPDQLTPKLVNEIRRGDSWPFCMCFHERL